MSREELFELELDVLVTLGFELSFSGPVMPMDRFFGLLKIEHISSIRQMTVQVCKYAYSEVRFLNYLPSEIAACAVLLCLNIYKRDEELFKKEGVFIKNEQTLTPNIDSFFNLSRLADSWGKPQIKINTSVWEDETVRGPTGYTID